MIATMRTTATYQPAWEGPGDYPWVPAMALPPRGVGRHLPGALAAQEQVLQEGERYGTSEMLRVMAEHPEAFDGSLYPKICYCGAVEGEGHASTCAHGNGPSATDNQPNPWWLSEVICPCGALNENGHTALCKSLRPRDEEPAIARIAREYITALAVYNDAKFNSEKAGSELRRTSDALWAARTALNVECERVIKKGVNHGE